MKLKIYTADGLSSDEREFSDFPAFEDDKGLFAVKQTIVAIMANRRQGTVATKTRTTIRGGNKKPFRQKGTGRARQGSMRSPQMYHGAVALGPQPRDWSQKVNRKMRHLAFRRSLFDRATDGGLVGIEKWDFSEPKTKALVSILHGIAPAGSVLLVDDQFDDNTILSARNLPRVSLTPASDLNVWDLARYDFIIASENALGVILQRANANTKTPAVAAA